MIDTLVKRYRALLARQKPERPEGDPSLNRTYVQLYQAQREHYFIDVQVDGDDVVYQSMILDLDPEEKTILIDELFPTGFEGLPGQRVEICIRQPKGRKVRFDSQILEQHVHDDAPVFVLAMPEEGLYADQRRKAYRLAVGSGIQIKPHFVGPDQQNYLARLRNLSSTGLGLEVEVDDTRQFNFNDRLKHVEFDFAGVTFDCDMTVRNISAADEAQKKVLIGAEFVDLPALEQRVLEKSIMRIQRDRIRLAGDMENQMAMS